jgi:hypothetical protein
MVLELHAVVHLYHYTDKYMDRSTAGTKLPEHEEGDVRMEEGEEKVSADVGDVEAKKPTVAIQEIEGNETAEEEGEEMRKTGQEMSEDSDAGDVRMEEGEEEVSVDVGDVEAKKPTVVVQEIEGNETAEEEGEEMRKTEHKLEESDAGQEVNETLHLPEDGVGGKRFGDDHMAKTVAKLAEMLATEEDNDKGRVMFVEKVEKNEMGEEEVGKMKAEQNFEDSVGGYEDEMTYRAYDEKDSIQKRDMAENKMAFDYTFDTEGNEGGQLLSLSPDGTVRSKQTERKDRVGEHHKEQAIEENGNSNVGEEGGEEIRTEEEELTVEENFEEVITEDEEVGTTILTDKEVFENWMKYAEYTEDEQRIVEDMEKVGIKVHYSSDTKEEHTEGHHWEVRGDRIVLRTNEKQRNMDSK